MSKLHDPILDPNLPYFENIQRGPLGEYSRIKKYEEQGEPRYDFLGHKLYLPFGIPAGPLPTNSHIMAAFNAGFDVAVYKTVRSREYEGNPLPNLFPVEIEGDLSIEQTQQGVTIGETYSEPVKITNSYGVPSTSPDFWQEDMAKSVTYTPKGKLVIGSFQGTTNGNGNVDEYIADFATTAEMVKGTGVPVMEVNLSCPNEGSNHLLCFDLERSLAVVKAIKEKIGETPLFLKLAYFADKDVLLKLITETENMVAGYSVINTLASRVITKTKEPAFPGSGREIAGVSGDPIRWAGLEMVTQLFQWKKDKGFRYTIIGLGGVLSAEHYTQYKIAGADIVLSAAGTMWNPYLAQEIKSLTLTV
jgi:dihydroorotate dehydrogenase